MSIRHTRHDLFPSIVILVTRLPVSRPDIPDNQPQESDKLTGHNRTHTKIALKVVDHAAILNFAVDIARGMKFLHELPRHQAPRFNLNPRHVVIDEDQRARLNLCDSHFSVLGNHKVCIS